MYSLKALFVLICIGITMLLPFIIPILAIVAIILEICLYAGLHPAIFGV